jgi:3-deoxy-D-manno-octulosonic-acid transferase
VTGELRFDQPLPEGQIAAGLRARVWLQAAQRPVTAFASVVKGEDDLFIGAITASLSACRAEGRPAPLYVYVPRAPERFGEVAAMLGEAGLAVGRRSGMFGADLAGIGVAPTIDVLLGDSMGEMYFYLAMADLAVVGGGFTAKGSHNISEPLALSLPVLTGPNIETIEYPAREALQAGVMLRLADGEDLRRALLPGAAAFATPARIAAFHASLSGAVGRTLAALPRLLGATSR